MFKFQKLILDDKPYGERQYELIANNTRGPYDTVIDEQSRKGDRFECAIDCTRAYLCNSISINMVTQECLLHYGSSETMNLESQEGFEFYDKSY